MRIVEPQTPQDWEIYFDLRWRMLRAPWQQPKGSEQDDFETSAYHLLAKSVAGFAVGVGRTHAADAHLWQIRYMAVSDDYRNQGIGKQILDKLECYARSHGAGCIILNAREAAVSFYLNNHYQIVAEGPTLFGTIHHKTMRKKLV